MPGNRERRISQTASTPIIEVTEDSSNETSHSTENLPDIEVTEYSSLLSRAEVKRYGSRQPAREYNSGEEEDSSDSDSGKYSASDELSSNSSSGTSVMTGRQVLIFCVTIISTFSSAFTVCLFPPFFPAIAESKGVSASGYGLIIGTNCLTAFIITPIVGNNLNLIGVKFAYCSGLFVGGVCCALAGMLEFFHPGPYFVAIAVLIRIVHAVSNAFVITSSFTYTACEFPTAVAKIFSLTRTAMNVAQLGGPWLGGMLYELGGFYMPFLVMGVVQIGIAFISAFIMPIPDTEDDDDDDDLSPLRRKKNKVSVFKMLTIPTIWFSFLAFIVATVCNGFLSVNLEPQIIRQFNLSPSNVGLMYGLRDGANSLASPIWGYLCDRKKSVKPYLILSALLVALSFFLMKGSDVIGLHINLTIPLLILALSLNGMGIGGQQVVGVVDALHEAVGAQYPDDACTQGLVAGLWSSLSGMGRFISRAGSGYLVDNFGFSLVAAIACSLQGLLAVVTFIYLVFFECHLTQRNNLRFGDVTIVEKGRRRDEKVVFTLPSESLMTRSVFIGIPHNSTGARIANSMPPKPIPFPEQEKRHRSRSVR